MGVVAQTRMCLGDVTVLGSNFLVGLGKGKKCVFFEVLVRA